MWDWYMPTLAIMTADEFAASLSRFDLLGLNATRIDPVYVRNDHCAGFTIPNNTAAEFCPLD